MKYETEITGLGSDALSFLDMDCNFLIIFDDSAPEELAEISILHKRSQLRATPEKGDTFTICGISYEISEVGFEVETTLRDLGHCTLSFDGSVAPAPGSIQLKGAAPSKEQIVIGGKIEIS